MTSRPFKGCSCVECIGNFPDTPDLDEIEEKATLFKKNILNLQSVDDEMLGNILEENQGEDDEDTYTLL